MKEKSFTNLFKLGHKDYDGSLAGMSTPGNSSGSNTPATMINTSPSPLSNIGMHQRSTSNIQSPNDRDSFDQSLSPATPFDDIVPDPFLPDAGPPCTCDKAHHATQTISIDTTVSGPKADLQYLWTHFLNSDGDESLTRFQSDVRGFTDLVRGKWTPPKTIKKNDLYDSDDIKGIDDISCCGVGWTQHQTYTVPLNAAIGPKLVPTNMDVTLTCFSKRRICLQMESMAPSVPSGTTFKTGVLLSLEQVGERRVRLVASVGVVWLQWSMLKVIIEKAVTEQMKEHYRKMGEWLQAVVKGDEVRKARRRKKIVKSGSSQSDLSRNKHGSNRASVELLGPSNLATGRHGIGRPFDVPRRYIYAFLGILFCWSLVFAVNLWLVSRIRAVSDQMASLEDAVKGLASEGGDLGSGGADL